MPQAFAASPLQAHCLQYSENTNYHDRKQLNASKGSYRQQMENRRKPAGSVFPLELIFNSLCTNNVSLMQR